MEVVKSMPLMGGYSCIKLNLGKSALAGSDLRPAARCDPGHLG